MDLLSIAGTVWRHKLVTIPVILLTLLGAFYVLEIKPSTYQASSTFLLANPPGPPSAAQIATDPKLGKINTNNPYTSYGNLSVVGSVVVDLVTTPAAQHALAQAGADPRYQIALNDEFGFTSPIVQITGIGSTAQEAILSANLVTAKAIRELYQMQKNQGVNRLYMIKPLVLDTPQQAQLSASGKLRTLVAVLALGAILLFVAVSVTDAMGERRKDRSINTHASPRTRAADTRPRATELGPRRPLGRAPWTVRPVGSRSLQRNGTGKARRELSRTVRWPNSR
jgi:hypothetical protein